MSNFIDVFHEDELRVKLAQQAIVIRDLRSMICRLRSEKLNLQGQLAGKDLGVKAVTTMPQIVAECLERRCKEQGVLMRLLLIGRRQKPVVRARWNIIHELYAMRHPDGRKRFSSVQLARYLNMDHASVLHAYKKMKARHEPEESSREH